MIADDARYEARMKVAYKDFLNSITIGREHDVRGRFIQHFVLKGLGYPENCYLNEQEWSDIWLLDKEPAKTATRKKSKEQAIRAVLPTVIIETKDFDTDDEKLLSESNLEQTFRYPLGTRGATQYVALTNFKRLIVWRVHKELDPESPSRPIADVNLKDEVETQVLASRLGELAAITYEEIQRSYQDFDVSPEYDLADPTIFEAFTSVVKWKILDETLIPRFYGIAQDLDKIYESFSERLSYLKSLHTKASSEGHSVNGITAADIDRQMRLLEEENRACTSFIENFGRWNRSVYSPASPATRDERIRRFSNETAYTILSRMLLVRIAESKGLLKQKISDGGLLNAVGLISQVNEAFKEVLRLAFRDARGHVYEHLFIDGIYDWYWEKDGVFNDAIKKALWYLNQYDFGKITRDVFKHVYQFHMDREERKQVGEYYTPDSVVGYILDKVGYVSTADLRQTHLLDPGCGSGTFLVEAVNRLKDLRVGLSPREILYMTAGRPGATRELGSIFGFDIVPFAAYLAEANLLFQLIDEIRSSKSEDPQFKIDKFQIYRTNSLQPADQVASMDDWVVGIETAEVSKAKQIKYDFVVGNPPYVEVENLRDKKAEIASYLKGMFPALLKEENLGRLELYIAFLAMGIKLLDEGGRLGFIVSAKFLATENGRWVRRLILENCAIEEIVDLMRVTVFPGQAVYPIILILRRESNESARHSNEIKVKVVLKDKLALLDAVKNIACEKTPTIPSEADYLAYTVPQTRFEQSPDFVFEIYASQPIEAIRQKILHGESERCPLSAIADTRQGVIAGGEPKWLQRLDRLGIGRFGTNFTVEEPVLNSLSEGERALYKKMINGDSVGHFESEWKKTRMYLCYDENWLTAPRERGVFEQPEKALLKAKTKYLQTSYDSEQLYCTNDVYIARWQPHPAFETSMKYLVALLNSRILDFCYKLRHAEYIRGGWFVRYAFVFDQLPIVKPTETQKRKLTGMVDQLISAKRASDSAEQTASSFSALLRSSKISLVTAGLSRLITNRENPHGSVERIARKVRTLYFDRRHKTFIECGSQEAAGAIARLLAEDFGRIKGQTLNDVLARVKLPKDAHDLNVVLRLEKRLLREAKTADEEFESLLEKLDYEVSVLYGLSDKEYLDLKNFVRLITAEEQRELPESKGIEANERSDESLDSHLGPSEVN